VDPLHPAVLGIHGERVGHPAGYFVGRSLLGAAAIVAVSASLAVLRYRRG
jgi:hypothetical protein